MTIQIFGRINVSISHILEEITCDVVTFELKHILVYGPKGYGALYFDKESYSMNHIQMSQQTMRITIEGFSTVIFENESLKGTFFNQKYAQQNHLGITFVIKNLWVHFYGV